MTPERLEIDLALPRMQALASRLWSRTARHHPGQLAWSAAYGEPEALDLGPVFVLDDAWAWPESPGWLEVCGVDPDAVRGLKSSAERDLGDLKREGFARCFVALHGRHGEDGSVQGALELLGHSAGELGVAHRPGAELVEPGRPGLPRDAGGPRDPGGAGAAGAHGTQGSGGAPGQSPAVGPGRPSYSRSISRGRS